MREPTRGAGESERAVPRAVHADGEFTTHARTPPPPSVLSCVYYKAATDTGSCSAFCERTGAARPVVVATPPPQATIALETWPTAPPLSRYT